MKHRRAKCAGRTSQPVGERGGPGPPGWFSDGPLMLHARTACVHRNRAGRRLARRLRGWFFSIPASGSDLCFGGLTTGPRGVPRHPRATHVSPARMVTGFPHPRVAAGSASVWVLARLGCEHSLRRHSAGDGHQPPEFRPGEGPAGRASWPSGARALKIKSLGRPGGSSVRGKACSGPCLWKESAGVRA